MNRLFDDEQLRLVARVIVRRVMDSPISQEHADRFKALVGSHCADEILDAHGDTVYALARPLVAIYPGLADELHVVALGELVMMAPPTLLFLPPPPLRLSGAMKTSPLSRQQDIFARLKAVGRQAGSSSERPMK